MSLAYFKRFRMEIDLTARSFNCAPPAGYRLVPWDASLVDTHAQTKFASFRGELDSNVFSCLGELAGCHRLMREISRKDGFLPAATWLAAYADEDGASEYCGTIQGVRDAAGLGAIQNLGITPEHRDQGVGTSLLGKCLEGFRQSGLRRAYLEVTAQNDGAIRLYQRFGFRKVRTVYKAVEVAYS